MDRVDAWAGTKSDLCRSAVVAADAVGPEPAEQVAVVAVAEEWFGSSATGVASTWGMTVIWSSPPITARTARISGFANAVFRSSARSHADEPNFRVVGNSTGPVR